MNPQSAQNPSLYNTLSRQKEPFLPLDWRADAGVAAQARRVRMYVCGPTVYDFAHIGNARPLIVFDVLFRLLRHLYGAPHVAYVRNITDVDDKINARAAERGISIRELTEETYRNFKQDVAALGCLPPSVEPRATEFVAPRSDGLLDMITLIGRLIANGHAYESQGHVLFDVPSMRDYGGLSRRPLDEMIAGARVEVAPYKRDPQDFVLWKPSQGNEPGWDSPWGFGRPGWHIECSAMSAAYLGETFDIHGGGIDLVFPHHENEIAQSRCAFHTPLMAQVWMHNGFLQVEGEKMSKSLGNFVTIREALADWPGEVLRLTMLRTHYRQPIDWTVKALEESSRILDTWYKDVGDAEPSWDIDPEFIAALLDDLNTPAAITRLHQITPGLRLSGGKLDDWAGAAAQSHKKSAAMLLGLLPQKASDRSAARQEQSGIDAAWVEQRLSARTDARKSKNFAESDRIRDELSAMGVVLKDSKEGTTWELAR